MKNSRRGDNAIRTSWTGELYRHFSERLLPTQHFLRPRPLLMDLGARQLQLHEAPKGGSLVAGGGADDNDFLEPDPRRPCEAHTINSGLRVWTVVLIRRYRSFVRRPR